MSINRIYQESNIKCYQISNTKLLSSQCPVKIPFSLTKVPSCSMLPFLTEPINFYPDVKTHTQVPYIFPLRKFPSTWIISLLGCEGRKERRTNFPQPWNLPFLHYPWYTIYFPFINFPKPWGERCWSQLPWKWRSFWCYILHIEGEKGWKYRFYWQLKLIFSIRE